MSHKYLLEVFSENEIPFPFNQKSYSKFDERDTYSLNFTLVCWLYERLRFFQEGTCIDLNFWKFNINGEALTQAQCIQRMINDCKILMTGDDYKEEDINKIYKDGKYSFDIKMNVAKDDLFMVLNKVYWVMWW